MNIFITNQWCRFNIKGGKDYDDLTSSVTETPLLIVPLVSTISMRKMMFQTIAFELFLTHGQMIAAADNYALSPSILSPAGLLRIASSQELLRFDQLTALSLLAT